MHFHAARLFAKVAKRILGILLGSSPVCIAATELWGRGERLDRLCANLEVDRRRSLSRCKRHRHVSTVRSAAGLRRDSGLDGGRAGIAALEGLGDIGKGIAGIWGERGWHHDGLRCRKRLPTPSIVVLAKRTNAGVGLAAAKGIPPCLADVRLRLAGRSMTLTAGAWKALDGFLECAVVETQQIDAFGSRLGLRTSSLAAKRGRRGSRPAALLDCPLKSGVLVIVCRQCRRSPLVERAIGVGPLCLVRLPIGEQLAAVALVVIDDRLGRGRTQIVGKCLGASSLGQPRLV